MDDTILTDEELNAAYYGECHVLTKGNPHVDGLRAVERAVLAKVDAAPCRCSREGYIRKSHAETEARKRERAAWNLAIEWSYFRSAQERKETAAAERDRQFPLPPRTVTLSSGERVFAESGSVSGARCVLLNATSVLTAADIAALADLVKSPTEPCE